MIAVGPGGVVDGKEVTMQVKAGDKVIYSKYSGTEVELEKRKIRDRKTERHFSSCRVKKNAFGILRFPFSSRFPYIV